MVNDLPAKRERFVTEPIGITSRSSTAWSSATRERELGLSPVRCSDRPDQEDTLLPAQRRSWT